MPQTGGLGSIMIDAAFKAQIPPLSPEEREQLEANIVAHGCRDPLTTWNGILLDGHNRLEICTRLGLPFKVVSIELPNREAAEDWIDANQLGRRNLTPDAFRLLVGRRYNRMKKAATGRADRVFWGDQTDPPKSTAAKLAMDYGTSEATVKRAARFAAEVERTPELMAAIAEGRPVLPVMRELKEREREERRQANRQKVAAVPELSTITGTFATIVIDPPWSHDDEGDRDQFGRARPDYATMTMEELLTLPVGQFADDAGCHAYVWTTNRSLPKGFTLLERWGFRYITTLTWAKPQPGLGNYYRGQTEHVLFGVRGSLALKRRDVGTVFHAPRGPGGHSSKPAEFYELVESCSPGPYLELFARRERPGWTVWGEAVCDSHGAVERLQFRPGLDAEKAPKPATGRV